MFLDMRSPLQAIKAGNVESNLYCKNFSLVSYTTNLYHDIIKHEAFTTVQVFLFFVYMRSRCTFQWLSEFQVISVMQLFVQIPVPVSRIPISRFLLF